MAWKIFTNKDVKDMYRKANEEGLLDGVLFYKARYNINGMQIEDIYAGRNLDEVKSLIVQEYSKTGLEILMDIIPNLKYAGVLEDILNEIHEDDLYSGYKALLSGVPCFVGASKHSDEQAILEYI